MPDDSVSYEGLSVREKATQAVREMGETGQITKVAWMMEIKKALNAQIEDCAKALDAKAEDWKHSMKTIKHFTGTYEEVELMEEMAEAIRALAAPEESNQEKGD